MASEPGVTFWPGMSLAETRLLARWCPAWRRRESDLLLSCGTWEDTRRCLNSAFFTRCCEREPSKRTTREELSTDARCVGGPVRSSGEPPAGRGGSGAKGPDCPWFVCSVNQEFP